MRCKYFKELHTNSSIASVHIDTAAVYVSTIKQLVAISLHSTEIATSHEQHI